MRPIAIAGIVLMLGGIGFISGGGILVSNAMSSNKRTELLTQQIDKQCKAQLARLGTVEERGNNIEVSMTQVTDPRRALGDATAATAMCPQHALTALCVGSACRSATLTSPTAAGGPVNLIFRLTKVEK